MSKWKNVRTYMEVNPYTGQTKDEDAEDCEADDEGEGDEKSNPMIA